VAEHNRCWHTCSTVRPSSKRRARSTAPSSRQRTVGLQTFGTRVASLRRSIGRPTWRDPDPWYRPNGTCVWQLPLGLATSTCPMHYEIRSKHASSSDPPRRWGPCGDPRVTDIRSVIIRQPDDRETERRCRHSIDPARSADTILMQPKDTPCPHPTVWARQLTAPATRARKAPDMRQAGAATPAQRKSTTRAQE
jgi:hypothetical protein